MDLVLLQYRMDRTYYVILLNFHIYSCKYIIKQSVEVATYKITISFQFRKDS